MTVSELRSASEGVLRLTLEVWHPGCWVLEASRQTDVGLVGYGCYSRDDGTTTSVFTLYADSVASIDEATDWITSTDAVYTVSEMVRDHRGHVHRPGNATRELLIDHDGTTQISDEFTDRGFVHSKPVDTRGNIEYWTVLTQHSREAIDSLLAEIRVENDATITVTSIAEAPGLGGETPLPVDQLSSRQREIFRLARSKGYYDHPRLTSAGELAAELGISSSTLHEHLRKVESVLLGS